MEQQKGIIYRKWGSPDQLEYETLEGSLSFDPHTCGLKRGELLVEVKAISVNPVDWKVMSGSQRLVADGRFPRVFGADFSGNVYRAGSAAEKMGFREGDPVMGMVSPLGQGSGRKWLKVRASHCIRIPGSLSYEEAASLPAAGMSAILATNFARKRKTGRILMIGAGGGVGSLALQILADRGWDISAVAREDQRDLLIKLGANRILDRNNWKAELEASDDGLAWDAVFDGPAAIIRNWPSGFLKRRGYYSPVFIPDPFVPFQIMRILLWTLTPYSTGLFLAAPGRKIMSTLEKLISGGVITPVIDSVWKKEDCAEAVSKSKKGGVTGKIVISMS